MTNHNTLWGIHAGRTGEADELFLRNNVIAIGWVPMGNLGELPPDREAFKTRVVERFSDVTWLH